MGGWSYSVNPIPGFPPYTGPYAVGTVDVEIPAAELLPPNATKAIREEVPETISFRCFYPCQAPDAASRPVLWVPQPQKETLHAFYHKFLNTSPTLSTVYRWMSQLLYYTEIPAKRNAPLLDPPLETKRWPVLVFSHGLAGSRNSYSHLCGSLAAHGIIVLAADHRDGSSPIQYIRATAKTPGRTLDYLLLPHNPCEEVWEGRDKQLRIRIAELSLLHEALLKIDRGEEVSNLDLNDNSLKKTKSGDPSSSEGLLSMFRDKLDIYRPGKITWAGHSFGGATSVQLSKSVYYASADYQSPLMIFPPSAHLKAQITPNTPVILFDPWGLPFTSPATASLAAQPLPCFDPDGPGGDALLTILSEGFFNWRGNLDQVYTALRDPTFVRGKRQRPQSHIFYPLRSAHLSQSDYGILFPNLTKYLAKADEPARTLRLNVRATLEVMRRAGIPVADTSEADLELSEIKDDAAGVDDGQEHKGDWRILSRDEGAVRGWIALSAEEENGEAVHREALVRTTTAQQLDRVETKAKTPLGHPTDTSSSDSDSDTDDFMDAKEHLRTDEFKAHRKQTDEFKAHRKQIRQLVRQLSSTAEREMVGFRDTEVPEKDIEPDGYFVANLPKLTGLPRMELDGESLDPAMTMENVTANFVRA